MAGEGQGWGMEFYDCVLNNDLKRLEALVKKHKIDLNARFTDARNKYHLDLSPVHLVAYQGYAGMLQYLLDMKCDLHITSSVLSRTPLHFSVLNQKVACFHKLLSSGVKADPRDTFNNTPCHYAAEDGNVLLLDVLLQQQTVDPNSQDITGKTPLMKATRNGKIDAMNSLLSARCLTNMQDKNNDTALHFAARKGNARLLVVLMRAGCDVNMQNKWGHSALIEAVRCNNKEATAVLLEAGCDVNLQDIKTGNTALHISVRKNYLVITEQLLASGRLTPIYNHQGHLALYDAILNHKMDAIQHFINYNYDLDLPCVLAKDALGVGQTAVQLAVDHEQVDLLRLFQKIGYRVCVDIPGSDGLIVADPTTGWLSFDPHAVSVFQHAVSELRGVQMLKAMSRRVIRKTLGFGVHSKVRTLPLPSILMNYVLLTDVLGEL